MYGLIAIVLAAVFMSDDKKNPFALSISVEEGENLKTLCLEEIVGFESGTLGKIEYCKCVAKDFSDNLLALKKFGESFKKTTKFHWTTLRDTRTKVRNIANAGASPEEFKSGSSQLDVLLKRFKLGFPVESLNASYEILAASTQKVWNRSLTKCAKSYADSPSN